MATCREAGSMLATISVSVFQVPSLGRLSVPMSRMLRRPVPSHGTSDGAAVAAPAAGDGGDGSGLAVAAEAPGAPAGADAAAAAPVSVGLKMFWTAVRA